jgi:hypothetical protein
LNDFSAHYQKRDAKQRRKKNESEKQKAKKSNHVGCEFTRQHSSHLTVKYPSSLGTSAFDPTLFYYFMYFAAVPIHAIISTTENVSSAAMALKH